jgi:hypothetical protein
MPTGLSAGAYPADAIVTGATSGAKGRVVDFDTVSGKLRIIRTSSENNNNPGANMGFQASELLSSVPGTGTSPILSILSPGVQKNSGDIIYSEYRSPVLRSALQTEDIKVIVRF